MNKSIEHIIILIITFCITVSLYSQDKKVEYRTLYNNKEYKKSLDLILQKLHEIYAARVSDKRLPTGFITMNTASNQHVRLVLIPVAGFNGKKRIPIGRARQSAILLNIKMFF